ncbi:MAG TPA: hypothetical protein VGR91_17245 [Stellaceae bacterium]|nr:hypothetical protein [Stellaceae bacterium]
MRKFVIPAALVAALGLGGCAQLSSAVGTVCTQVQAIESNPAAAGPLDAQDPHSAVGVLWADAKAACVNGAPAPGVSTNWAQLVTSELLALIPSVLPALIGLF